MVMTGSRDGILPSSPPTPCRPSPLLPLGPSGTSGRFGPSRREAAGCRSSLRFCPSPLLTRPRANEGGYDGEPCWPSSPSGASYSWPASPFYGSCFHPLHEPNCSGFGSIFCHFAISVARSFSPCRIAYCQMRASLRNRATYSSCGSVFASSSALVSSLITWAWASSRR